MLTTDYAGLRSVKYAEITKLWTKIRGSSQWSEIVSSNEHYKNAYGLINSSKNVCNTIHDSLGAPDGLLQPIFIIRIDPLKLICI